MRFFDWSRSNRLPGLLFFFWFINTPFFHINFFVVLFLDLIFPSTFLFTDSDPWKIISGRCLIRWDLRLNRSSLILSLMRLLSLRWYFLWFLSFYIFGWIYFLDMLLWKLWILFLTIWILLIVFFNHFIVHLVKFWIIFQSIGISQSIQTMITGWTSRGNASNHNNFRIVTFGQKGIPQN